MPPRLARSNALRPSRRKPIALIFCPSCSLWRLAQPAKPRIQPSISYIRREQRYASTIGPATSINAPVEVPVENQKLYHALDVLRDEAGTYVNWSRLQLALRGLQAKDAVVRVAVLGMGDQRMAQLLVKALLADPLSDAARWEAELEENGDGRTLLLRYGEEGEISPANQLLKTIPIPSSTLRKHNIEILISSVNINAIGTSRSTATESPFDALLVPTLQTPTSFSGRHTLVTYPVHKTVVIGDGVENSIAYGRYTASQATGSLEREMVKVAIGLPAPETEQNQTQSESASAFSVDVALANEAVSKFRESVANSIIYERGWFRSGVAPLQKWLFESNEASASAARPAILSLTRSILEDTSTKIELEESQRVSGLFSSTVPAATKASILSSIAEWAEKSHRELRDQLDAAFAGRHWRKIAWWKLFWRVDDVTMITSEVLERRWLHEAEKGTIFIAGRIREAGFSQEATHAGPITSTALPEVPEQRAFRAPPPPTLQGLTRDDLHQADEGLAPHPQTYVWPPHIPNMRAHLLSTTVPPLQALAQSLVLQTYSTTGLMSALAALTYVASPAWALEAGAIAAFGVIWSLRRLQRRWEGAREFWEADVREEARKALKETEAVTRALVEEVGKPEANLEGAEERKIAREAVDKARAVLESYGQKKRE